MAWNRYKARAIARRNWSDDKPKWMHAKRAGTCEHCGKPFPAGEFIAYSLGKCWHEECHAKRNEPKPLTCAECGETIDQNEKFRADFKGAYHPHCYKEPEPEPEPITPDWLPIDLKWGTLEYREHCDGLILWEDNAVYLSVIGSDSRIKGITGCFLEHKPTSRNRWKREGLSYQLPGKRYNNSVTRETEPAKYRRLTTKLGSHAHQICALEQFFADGPAIERDYRYLLFDPRTHNPAQLVVSHIVDSLPVPFLPAWTSAVYEQLRANADTDPGNMNLARCWILPPQIGTRHAARVRVTEESMDNLISDLVKQGKIEF